MHFECKFSLYRFKIWLVTTHDSSCLDTIKHYECVIGFSNAEWWAIQMAVAGDNFAWPDGGVCELLPA